MDDTEETSPSNTSILVYLFHTKSTVFFNFFETTWFLLYSIFFSCVVLSSCIYLMVVY